MQTRAEFFSFDSKVCSPTDIPINFKTNEDKKNLNLDVGFMH